ncbi:polycystin-1-like protein 1 [Saccostrea echinata]|uniref:polycystin-1-like protein 1 n=1 Tax=Saccostrea echinata TaxID=191078 RepID=UPI002A81B3D5|nr:polycystin-1-like protein 1 [Saccostrea echinata]
MRYRLVAVSLECVCLNDTEDLTEIESTGLSQSGERKSCLRVPSCPGNSSSVFLVEGPFIAEVKATVNVDHVIVNRPVVIEIVVKIPKLLNISKGLENQTQFSELNIEWSFSDSGESISTISHSHNESISTISRSHNESISTEAQSPVTYQRVQHTFRNSGPQVVDVYVSNRLSELSATLSINVLEPSPHDLEIVNFVDLSDQPSCTPEGYDVPVEAQFFSVFRGANFSLEVSVSVGEDVTFFFEETKLGIKKVKPADSCSNGCSLKQWFVVQSLGVHQLWVTAQNHFGKQTKSIYVVVIQRNLSNVRFSLADSDSRVVPSGTVVNFLIQAEIHSRFNSTLIIDVLDGHTHRALLEDTEGQTLALNCTLGEMFVTTTYGIGCLLNIRFEHAFEKEAVYRPTARIFSSNFSEIVELDSELLVMKRLGFSQIISPGICSVGQACEFDLQCEPFSIFADVTWTISKNNNSVDVVQGSLKLSYVFTEPGYYQISTVTQNSLSTVTESTNVHILVPLSDLYVQCDGGPVYPELELILCRADVMGGSNAQFSWIVHPEIQPITTEMPEIQPISTENTNLSSEAVFTFQHKGLYNISITAYNRVSKLTSYAARLVHIQEKIQCVVMKRERSVYPRGVVREGEVTLFLVKTCGGSHVKLEFDLGTGRQTAKVLYIKEEDLYEVNFRFSKEGLHTVVVFAFNDVSEVQFSTRVLVQRQINGLSLEMNQIQPHVNSPLVFKVTEEGNVCRRDDLVYTFTFSDGQEVISGSPAVSKVFNQSGVFSANVTVNNLVDSVVLFMTFTVKDDGNYPVTLSNPIFSAVNQLIKFRVQGVDVEAFNIEVHFGDQDEAVIVSSTQWEHTYDKPGIYEVSSILHTVSLGNLEVSSVIIIQEKLQDVTIRAPSVIKIDRISREHLFEADITVGGSQVFTGGGSQVLYFWSLDNRQSPASTVNWVIEEIDQPGTSVLTVGAQNDLGDKLFAVQEVKIQFPLLDVTLTSVPTVEGRVCDITIRITGSQDIVFDVDFGDGIQVSLSDDDVDIVMDTTSSSYLPTYTTVLKHQYDLKGQYKVKVNVSNDVSWVTGDVTVMIGEAIGDVKLEILSPHRELPPVYVVSLSDPLTVRVTVGRGDNLTFTWDFSEYSDGGTKDQLGNESSSTATYAFSMTDIFPVSVSISSPYYPIPQVFPFKHKFKVVQEIQGVYLEVEGSEKKGAALKRVNGKLQTEELHFLASCEKGSHIAFKFDFGDGATTLVQGREEMFLNYVKGSASHRYTQEGVFNITVTAINPLGNRTTTLDRLFYVQASPFGLKLDKSIYYTKLGDVTIMHANYSHGTNVTFDWKLGDQTDILSDSGSVVRHTYQTRGEFRVTVIARNKVSSQTDQAMVVVQSLIQGVRLITSANITETNQVIKLRAETLPEQGLGTYHHWNLGDNQKGVQTTEPEIDYRYRRNGRFIATVKAYNNISQSESVPVEITVLSKVKNLEVRCLNDSLVNTSLEFAALSYSGSNLTYIWDFGDGTPPLQSTVRGPQVRHTYVNVGQYFVTLTAYNQISNETDRIELFVLDRVCKLPKFEIHSRDVKKIIQSDRIFFEAEITRLHCEYTSEIEYQWSFVKTLSNTPVLFENMDPSQFQHRVLNLPPRSLEPGEYTLSLMVKYSGTIVYATKKTQFELVSAPLSVHIDGGAFRRVGRSGNVMLNGTKSTDPNSEDSSQLRFNWTCSVSLTNIEESCFLDHKTLDTTNPVLTFPAAWLETGKQYLFILNVSSEGLASQNRTQVIEVDSKNTTIDVGLRCPLCQRDVIDENEPIRIEAVCPECVGQTDISYEWRLWFVEGYHGIEPQEPKTCITAGESQFELLKKSNRTAIKSTTDRTTTVIGTTTKEYKTEVSTMSVSTTDVSLNLDPVIIEDRSSKDRVITNGNKAEDKLDSDFPFISENTKDVGRRKPGLTKQDTGMVFPVEGSPGEVGSSDGRIPGQLDSMGEEESRGRDPGQNNGGGGGRDSDKVIDNEGQNPVMSDTIDLLINRRASMKIIRAHQIATPTNSRSLVIKPYQLSAGRAYIISLKVKNGQKTGMAKETFYVNSGPINGDCEVAPLSGEEFKTEFKVFCREWQDKQQPIQYQVTFDLGSNQSEVFLYRGLKKSLLFTLPAGLPENKFKVFLKVSVLDGRNAAVRHCVTSITVRPGTTPTRTSTSAGEYQGHSRSGSEIARADDKISEMKKKYDASLYKDDSQTRLLTLYLAMLLNKGDHSGQYKGDHSGHRSQYKGENSGYGSGHGSLHQQILRNLWSLPVQDEVEVLQTLQALVQLTSDSHQMSKVSLSMSTSLLQSLLEKSVTLYTRRQSPIQGLLTLAVEAGSNIVKAISMAAISRTDLWFFREKLAQSINALERFVRNELAYHMVGESPIRTKESAYISAQAGLFEFQDTFTLKIGQSKIMLPKQLASLSNIQNRTRIPNENRVTSPELPSETTRLVDCVRVEFLRYHTDPFQFVQKGGLRVNTEVTTLNVYDCHGNSLKSLHEDDPLTIQLPRRQQKIPQETVYQLHKSTMNVHQFNLTKSSIQQTLHIHIKMVPETRGRLFPTALLIGYKNHPTPQRFLLKKETPATENEIQMFLPAGYFNVSGEYYLGFVDAKYNAGRPRPGEVQSRNYTLQIWHTQCLYWQEDETHWSHDGCWTTDKSTYHVTHCRCNHLSTFGAFFGDTAPVLTLIPVETFFEANKNSVCITILVMALVVYCILMVVCHKMDQHDARKGGILYLRDNAVSDQQKYEIIVETGFRRGAGTTAKISIILHGEEGMSGTRELISDDDRPMFERNSRDKFILTLPDSIGKIWKVQIWHNNSGSSPSWYLSRVIVKDLNNERMFYFISEKWLAVEEEDGKVEREFLALDGNLGFKTVFMTKGTQYLADYHLWMSPFTCPSYSQFTRTQRLTCCLTLFTVYMCLNTLVYHYTHKEYRGEFGLLDLSWSSIAIGTVCCLVALPLNLLLSFLFRRSKLVPTDNSKASSSEDKDEDAYPSGKPNENSQEEETDTSAEVVQPIMTYSILDQSILNWPAIQGWAQKQWIKRQHTTIKECPSSTTDTLLNRLISSETDMASSGFEDSNSTDPRPQMTSSSTASNSPASSIKNKASSESSQITTKCPAPSKKNPSSRLLLPTWMKYVAWCLCGIVIVCSALLTVWIGFRFDEVRSVLWLQSLYISVLVCVFLVHPTIIFCAVLYTAVRYRCEPTTLDHYEESFFGETAEKEILRRKKEQSCENGSEAEELEKAVAARQRSRYLRFARPPQEKQLIEARKNVMKEKKSIAILLDMASLVVTFLIVSVMAYGKDIQPEYQLNKAVYNHFIREGSPNFASIKNRLDWYEWTSTTLIDKIYIGNSREKQKPVLKGTSYIIGDVQLRKVKEDERGCVDMSSLPYISLKCRKFSSSLVHNQDNGTFRGKTSPYLLFGRHGIYDNSGYVLKLDHSRHQAMNQIRNLITANWIDDYTKAIFIEFTLFHPPSSLFTSVIMILEIPDTGRVFPSNSISSTYVYRYTSRTDHFVLFCEVIFILITVWRLKMVVCQAIKLRSLFLQCGWEILQGILCMVSVAYIGCNVYRFFLVSEVVELQQRTYNEEFVDVSFITFWDEMLRCMVGFIMFIVILQSLRLLRYERMFLLFGKIYSRAHKELKLLAVLLIILLLAFASLGHALFRAFFLGFMDFWSSIFTVSAIFSGRYIDLTSEPSLIHASRIFLLFSTVLSLGLGTAYVVVFLTYRFHVNKRRQHKMSALCCPETFAYYWRMLRQLSGWSTSDVNSEPEIEPDNTLPPEFTMAEVEYQVDELFFRISGLSGSHGLPEKPNNYFTDSDGTYTAGDDGISSGGSEVPDEERLEHRVHQIEDNLCSAEPYLAQLLKIDNIGIQDLSKDQENQIRSHLELEIFRQLQNQRQDPIEEGLKSGTQVCDTAKAKPHNADMDVNQMNLKPNAHFEGSDAERRSAEVSSSNPDSPESTKNPTTKKTKQRDTSPENIQNKTKPQGAKATKKPELPTKPTFIMHGPVRGALSNDVPKPSLISSPTLRQLKSDKIGLRGERGGIRGESNSGSSITESSSGSEQDAIHGHMPAIGKRNLRKTKSRGKGKGPVNLSSVLLDEIEGEHLQTDNSGNTEDHFIILEHDVLEDVDDGVDLES